MLFDSKQQKDCAVRRLACNTASLKVSLELHNSSYHQPKKNNASHFFPGPAVIRTMAPIDQLGIECFADELSET